MKNILLIQPKFYEQETISPPLSLMYISSFLEKKGFKVNIIDTNIEKDYLNQIINFIEERKPILVGFSVMVGLQILSAKIISEKIRKLFPDIKIVWGGPFPSVKEKIALKEDFVDIVVIGEGEKTFLELAQNKKLEKIKGIAFRKNKDIVMSNRKECLNMNDLPPPSFHLIKYSKYEKIYLHMTRGCPFDCDFCSIPLVGRLRGKSPKKMLEEIKLLREKYKQKHFYLWGEGLLANKKRLRELFELLQKKNLFFTWTAWARIEYLKNTEILKYLYKHGLRWVTIGIESSSEERRKNIGKNFSNKEIFKSLDNCKKSNIKVRLTFMVGLPNETMEEIKKTLDFMDTIEQKFGFKSILIPYREYPSIKLSKNKQDERSLEEWAYQPFFIKKINKIQKDTYTKECMNHSLYYKNLKISTTNKMQTILRKIQKAIGTFRWKHRFFIFPIEIYVKKILLLSKIKIDMIKIKLS